MRQLQILIVDADASAAQATKALVQHLVPGASLACATTPERGWNAAQRRSPDVLVIDPAPSTSQGILLLQLCKESWPAMRTIVLASAPLSAAQVRQCRADAYLEKPTAPAQLHDELRRVLDGANGAAP